MQKINNICHIDAGVILVCIYRSLLDICSLSLAINSTYLFHLCHRIAIVDFKSSWFKLCIVSIINLLKSTNKYMYIYSNVVSSRVVDINFCGLSKISMFHKLEESET